MVHNNLSLLAKCFDYLDNGYTLKKCMNSKIYNYNRIPRFVSTGTEELDLPSVFVSPSLKDIWSNSSTEGKYCSISLYIIK